MDSKFHNSIANETQDSFGNGESFDPFLSIKNLLFQNQQLSAENLNLQLTIKDLQSRLQFQESSSTQNSKNFINEISQVKSDSEISRKKLVESIQILESKLNQQILENKKLTRQKSDIENSISSFLNSISKYSNQTVNSFDAVLALFNSLNTTNESINNFSKLNEENIKLTTKLNHVTKHLKTKEKETLKLKKLLVKNHNKYSVLQTELENLNNLKIQYEQQIKDDESIIQNQKDQIAELESLSQPTAISFDLNQTHHTMTQQNIESNESALNALLSKLQASSQSEKEKNEVIRSLKETIDQLNQKCNQLNQKLDDSQFTISTHEETEKTLKEKLKKLKQIIQKLKDEASVRETELTEYNTTIHELQLKVGQLESQKVKLPIEKKISITQNKPADELFEQKIIEIEKLFDSQSNEIEEMSKQRNLLITKLMQFDQFLTKSEEFELKLMTANKAKEKENVNLQRQYKLNEEKEKFEFERAYNECLSMLPKEFSLQFSCNLDNTKSDILKEFVRVLIDSYERKIKEITIETNSNSIHQCEQRNKALLCHLQDACKLLKNVSTRFDLLKGNGLDDKTLEFDRKTLLQECIRLDSYIRQEKLSFPIDDQHFSMLEPSNLNDPQKVADVFLSFVDQESFQKSPINELFTLFMCISQVNRMMASEIETNRKALEKVHRTTKAETMFSSEIDSLHKWQEDHININKKLRPLLTSLYYSEDQKDPEDYEYEELVSEVVKQFENNTTTLSIQNQELLQKIDELEQLNKVLLDKIDNAESKQAEERQDFCHKADKIVNQIQQEMENNVNQHQAEIEKLKEQLQEKQNLLDNAKELFQDDLNKAKEKVEKRNEAISALKQENDHLNQQLLFYKTELNDCKNQIEENSDSISQLETKLNQTTEKLINVIKSKNAYKQKLGELESNKKTVLKELRLRNEELNHKYSQSIENLEHELEATKSLLNEYKHQLEMNEKQKQEMLLLNAKLKMSERTATLKLQAANDALEREKGISITKEKSLRLALKAKSDSIAADDDKLFINIIDLLNTILVDEFDCRLDPQIKFEQQELNTKDRLGKVLNDTKLALQQRKSKQYQIKDAFELRKYLSLSPSSSLYDAYKNQENLIEQLKNEHSTEKCKLLEAQNMSKQVQRENERLERAAFELNEWTEWGKLMLRQLTDASVTTMSQTPKEIRFFLEESLISSIDLRKIIKRIDILRQEKKMLITKPYLVKTKAQLKIKEPLKSIIPVIISLRFAKRIQHMSDFLPH